MSTTPSWHEARDLAFQVAHALLPTLLPIDECGGLKLAADVRALRPMPHYDSSAMDGYAVAGAGDGPWQLVDTQSGQHAGRFDGRQRLEPGQATPVVTGGLIPDGATTVLRSEQAAIDGATLRTTHPPLADNLHIRPRGEEAAAGDVLVPASQVLTPPQLAVASVAGHDRLLVHPAPSVHLVFTGDEVDVAGLPGPGRVRDAFGPQLPSVVEELGGRVVATDRLPDDADAVRSVLESSTADVVITTGGTGRSSADHVRATLLALDAEMLIDGIKVRPGHPAVLAQTRGGSQFVIGLPGNPLAAMMTMLTLTQPLLAGLRGREAPSSFVAQLGVDIEPSKVTRLLPARYTRTSSPEAISVVEPTERTGSGMLRGLAMADVVIVVPAAGLPARREIECLALPWSTPAPQSQPAHADPGTRPDPLAETSISAVLRTGNGS